jgi:hypothetical protein
MVRHTAREDHIETAARHLEPIERHEIHSLRAHVAQPALRHLGARILQARTAQVDARELRVGLQRSGGHQPHTSTSAGIQHRLRSIAGALAAHPAEQQARVHSLAESGCPGGVGEAVIHRTHPLGDGV